MSPISWDEKGEELMLGGCGQTPSFTFFPLWDPAASHKLNKHSGVELYPGHAHFLKEFTYMLTSHVGKVTCHLEMSPEGLTAASTHGGQAPAWSRVRWHSLPHAGLMQGQLVCEDR